MKEGKTIENMDLAEFIADPSVKEMTYTEFRGFLSVMPDGVMVSVCIGKEAEDGRDE